MIASRAHPPSALVRLAPLLIAVLALAFMNIPSAHAVDAPTVTAVSPATGPTSGGGTATITGTGFTGATSVKFGTVAAPFLTNSDTSISATIPAGVAGPVNVFVTTANGTNLADTGNVYTYVAPVPTVTAVSPSSGLPAGGTSVTLTGTNFTGATSVHFGAASAAFLVNSDTSITATAPASAATPPSAVNVTVTTGSGTSTATASNVYTYSLPGPVVTSIAPSTGSVAGGTTVVLTGTGFTGATAVKFGTTTAAFTVNSDTQITTTAPAGSAGSTNITVTGPNGTSAVGTGNTFTYTGAALAVSGVSPSSGPLAGGTSVIITGSGFTGATAVTFGGIGSAYTVNSDSQITATAPVGAAAGVVSVQVTTPAGNSANNTSSRYTYNAPQAPIPVVTSLNPSSGNVAGGTVVIISGSNFTGTTAVTFGGLTASISVNSDSQITAVAPAHSAGQVDVVVSTLTGTSTNTAGDNYTYTGTVGPPPTPICPDPVLWVNDVNYGSIGGGFYWDSVSGQVWTGQRGWHLFAPVPTRPNPQPLWVNALSYGSIGGGFWWDPVSNTVWTQERGWHLYNPQGCVKA